MTDITSIALSVGFMAVLGSVLASILVLANKRLFVYEDPRIDDVEDLLAPAIVAPVAARAAVLLLKA